MKEAWKRSPILKGMFCFVLHFHHYFGFKTENIQLHAPSMAHSNWSSHNRSKSTQILPVKIHTCASHILGLVPQYYVDFFQQTLNENKVFQQTTPSLDCFILQVQTLSCEEMK